MGLVTAGLPEFPWDRLIPYGDTARAHPDGIVDLSIGTPVDPTPASVQQALAEAADAPGYPTVVARGELREAFTGWLERRAGVPGVDPSAVLVTLGSKELVALAASLLGLGAGDKVALPSLAYPTYDVGALVAGAQPVVCGGPDGTDPRELDPSGVRLLWLNSPSNPTGAVLDTATLRAYVAWAREHDVLVLSDECYLEFGWSAVPVSVLSPEVSEGDHTGLLALHSLSKHANLAGYRVGFATGDQCVVDRLVSVRKHLGFMVPTPIQRAAVVALGDDESVEAQRVRYQLRREALRPALEAAGWRVDHSEAGLYLWATRPGEDCWSQLQALSRLGILAAPGEFYGAAGREHLRVALTGTDERIAAAAARLQEHAGH